MCWNWSFAVDVVGVIVASVIPVLIMIFTLYSEKRKHQEQLNRIDEKNRIEAMPVIDVSSLLITGITQGDCDEIVSVEAMGSFINVGNGTAINIFIDNALDVKNEVISKGMSSNVWELRLKKDERAFPIEIRFKDLYGNRYREIIELEVSKNGATYEMNRVGLTAPILIDAEEKQ